MSSSTIGSHSSRGLADPNCSRTSPSLPTAPLPWMYLPGAANTAAIGPPCGLHTPSSSLEPALPHTTRYRGYAQRTLHRERRSGDYLVGKIVATSGMSLISVAIILVPGALLFSGMHLDSFDSWLTLTCVLLLGLVATMPMGGL